MASSNKTSNYQLNQWISTDQVRMADFNADNQKIDAALNTLAAGQLRIATGSYTGNGKYGATNPNTLTFPFVPLFVLLYPEGDRSYAFWHILIPGTQYALGTLSDNLSQYMYMSWNGTTASYYAGTAEYQNNGSGKIYKYIAIG